jgi:SAM-dependent methyltransferase
MARSTSRLQQAHSSLSLVQRADLARQLISANELYAASNTPQYTFAERQRALHESAALANEVLQQLPSDIAALNLCGRIALDQGEANTAEVLIRQALEQEPGNVNSRLNYAYVLMAKRQYGEAEALFREVLQDQRNSVRAFSGIALARLRQRDWYAAFGHYRRLIELGHDTAPTRAGLLDAAEFLRCDSYQRELEPLLLSAYRWDGVEHQKLAHLAGSLLVAKYRLDDPNAILDLQCLVRDELLLAALSKSVLPSVAMEALVRELRKTLLLEISTTRQLRDEIMPFAIAIGHYACRTDYALMVDQEEELLVQALAHQIHDAVQRTWSIEDLCGALVTLSMYETLYSQTFSVHLLREELSAWPEGMRSLLSLSLYELSEEHLFRYQVFGVGHDELLDNGIKRAGNRWQQLSSLSRTRLHSALTLALPGEALPERFRDQPLSVLLIGCGSGQRAFHLAECFDQLTVYAIDPSRYNIGWASLQARRLGHDNLHFIHSELESALIAEECFDLIEFSDALNHVEDPAAVIAEWLPLLADDGLLRLNLHTRWVAEIRDVIIRLVRERRLSPTADNIRHLRNAISQEASSGLWNDLFNDERFYTATGCQSLFFQRHNHYFDLQQVATLLRQTGLSFSGFVDLPEALKRKAQPLLPHDLLAWHGLEQDEHAFGEYYSLYCRKA